MSVEWPAALPLPQFGLRYNVTDPQMRTLMASGRTISRRRFSDVPTEFSARWILRQSEAEIFEQFYQNDAVDGSEWVEMPLVTAQGEGVHYVRFRGAYQYRRVGAGLWEYTANLQMYLRPGSPEWPPGVSGSFEPPENWPPETTETIKSGFWEIRQSSNSAWEEVPPSLEGGLYFGGFQASQVTANAASNISIISIGDWFKMLPPQDIYIIVSAERNRAVNPSTSDSAHPSFVKGTSLSSQLEPPTFGTGNSFWGPMSVDGVYNFYGKATISSANTEPISITLSVSQGITKFSIVAVGVEIPA